jgi:hypothetical protein
MLATLSQEAPVGESSTEEHEKEEQNASIDATTAESQRVVSGLTISEP